MTKASIMVPIVAKNMRQNAITKGEWYELPIPFNEEVPDGTKLFKIIDGGGVMAELPRKIEFAVKAEFDGFDAYDDNRGQNYLLGGEDGPLLNVPLVLRSCNYYKDRIYGTIFLRNYGFHKKVRVFYSMDKCGSFSCINAAFRKSISTGPKDVLFFPNVYGCEAWEFSIHFDCATSSLPCFLFV